MRVAEHADDPIGVEAVAVAEDLEEAPRPSSASLPPVNPRAASSAAMTPFCAARPTCSGLVIVPKLTRMPEADARGDRERVRRLRPASRPSSFAAAAAAPNVPMVPDEWNPFL